MAKEFRIINRIKAISTLFRVAEIKNGASGDQDTIVLEEVDGEGKFEIDNDCMTYALARLAEAQPT